MFESPLLKKLGVTPIKLVVIGVLACVLLGVIVLQWPSNKAPAPTQSTKSNGARQNVRTAANSNAAVISASPQAENSTPPSAPWPEFALEEVVHGNPFLLPAGVRPAINNAGDNPTNPQDATSQQILQELSQAKSAIVLMVGPEHVARIGANRIRTGDKIGPYRVSKIDATGVWLVDESEADE